MSSRSAPAVVALALLAGCGGSAEEEVTTAVQSLGVATYHRDARTFCALLSRELVARVERAAPCPDVVALGLARVERPTLRVRSVTVDGDRATARVLAGARGRRPAPRTVRLVREGDVWRIAATGDGVAVSAAGGGAGS